MRLWVGGLAAGHGQVLLRQVNAPGLFCYLLLMGGCGGAWFGAPLRHLHVGACSNFNGQLCRTSRHGCSKCCQGVAVLWLLWFDALNTHI